MSGTTATPTAVSEVTASTVYDVTVSGGNLADRNATVTLAFAAGQNIADTADNALSNTTPTGANDNDYVVDNAKPTVTITGVPMTSTAAFTATITFLEPVNGFAVGDITVGNGTAASFTGSNGDTVFTALITPTADGAVTVDVAADVATDAAGNGNTAAAQASSVFDSTAPRVTSIARQTPASSPTNANSLTWRVTFSEDVENVDAMDFQVSGTTATPTAVSEVTASTVYDVTVSGGNLADRNATVTLAFAAGRDIVDTADNALSNTTPTGANDNDYVVDNAKPTVTITGVPMTSTAAFTATITFLEPVNGFAVGDITVGNGTAASFTGSNGDTVFTALITPTADGAVTVDVAADVATDAAGNGNTAAAQVSSVFDSTAPRVTSIARQTPASSPTNANSLTWRVTFSEDVENVDTMDFQVSGTTATPTAVSEVTASTVYDVTVSGGNLADRNATVTLAFAAGRDIADTADNALSNTTPTGANDNDYVVDNAKPTVTITGVPMTSTAAFTATITFLEPVNGFAVGDITVGNGTAASFTGSNGDTVFTALITPTADGAVTVDVAADVATDAAGNGNTAAAQASSTYTAPLVDNTAPRVTSIARQTPASSPTNANSLTWRVTFSEDVENVDAADFQVSGTTATPTAVSEITASTVYDVTVSGGNLADRNATVTLAFAAGQDIVDTADNALSNTTPTGANDNDYVVDNAKPTVTITGVPMTSTAAFTATITFLEPVNGFAVGDITVGNGTAASFTGSNGDTVFTALITPTADGAVTVDVAADVATDAAGNGNTAAAQASSVFDSTAPRVTSIARQTPASSPTNANSLTWRVTFSEDVENVDATDFQVSGTTATPTAVSEVTASTVYDVTVSGGNLADRNATVTLAFAAGRDIADTADNALSNTTPTGANDNDYVVDNAKPTVTITGVPMTSTAAFTATITFLEPVNGFAVGDITVGNGTAASFTGSDGDTVFTALITPTADGAVTVDVAADVATDAAGNGNTAAAQASSTYTAPLVDNTAPRVTSIARQTPASSPTNANSLTWRVTFSEDVANVDAADFQVSGTTATPTAVSEVTASTVYDVTVSGGNLADRNATVTLAFAAGRDIVDTADNALSNTTPTGANDNDYVVDNAKPTVTITGVPMTSTAAFTATITFLEPVNGFAVGDITVGNGTAASFTGSDGDTVFTALITPTADGAVTVDVAADVATDAAGNGNTAAAQASSVFDSTAPRVTSIARQTPASSPTNANSLTWRVTFSEDVENVDTMDFQVSGTTATPTAVSEVTASTVYDVTVSGGNLADRNATVTLAFAAGRDIADTADNALSNTTPTGANDNDYVVDNAKPTVTITGVPMTSTAAFTATITFLEPVNGFAVGDITVGNGTAASFTGSDGDTVFTALITPTADGAVTVDVAADVATDAAGNGNTAAAQASSTYTAPLVDNTAPRVMSIARQTPASSLTNANSLTWRVTFSEDVENVDTMDFQVSGTTATPTAVSEVTASTVYDVTVSGGNLADRNATVTLAFAAGRDIVDTADNALSNTTPMGANDNDYVVNNAKPTVTITPAWIARFGRTVAEQMLDAVEGRMHAGQEPGTEVSLAGERIGVSPEPGREAERDAQQLVDWLKSGPGSDEVQYRSRGVTPRDLLTGSAFTLTAETAGKDLVSLWGRGTVTRFDGREGELTLDGEVLTGMLGADWSRGRRIAGLIVSHSTAEGGYSDGRVKATMTGLFLWGHHALSERLEAWGTAGYGAGELTVTPKKPVTDEDGAAIRTNLDLGMAAGGLRGTMLDGGEDSLTLTGKTDAMVVQTASGHGRSAAGVKLESARATVTRLRLGLEASRPVWLGGEAVLTPSLEVGVRHDSGDAETGVGLDLGIGLALNDPKRGLQVEMRGRGLLAHESGGFRDLGFSSSLAWEAKPSTDRGAKLRLTQTVGGPSSGGADALLARRTLDGLATNDDDDKDELKSRRLELGFGYGLPAFGDRFTWTPEAGVRLSDTGRDYSLGWRLVQGGGEDGSSLELAFGARRSESANDDTQMEHAANLWFTARF